MEGFSLPILTQVITTGGDTNPIRYKQQNGRGKTLDIYNKNKITRIINIYIDDFYSLHKKNEDGSPKFIPSRDKSKLLSRQSQSDNIIVEVSSVDDIH